MPSEKIPVAVNCLVVPLAIEGLVGVIEIEERVAADTVKTVFPVMALSVALIVAVPTAAPVATPSLLIVVILVLEELHVAWVVKS